MDWKAIISELVGEHGMKQPQIAASCKCGQSTISDIARGETKDPRHSIGEALKHLLAVKRAEKETLPKAPPPCANGGAAVAVLR